MIDALRTLDPPRQRQLIRLLDARVDLDELADDELLYELVAVLRRVLDVPAKDDLPEYLRRRLVEVTKRHFDLIADTDTTTDLELAGLLVDFILDAAAEMAKDAETREEFETFLRTKDRAERTRWLVQSQRFAALVRDELFDRAAAHERAERLAAEQGGHRETAKAILGDLGAISVKSSARSKTAPGSAKLAARAAAGGGGAAALGPAIAVPLGALAGGLFMSGRAKRGLVKVAETDAAKTRALRARRSRQVQAVVVLSAFLIASGADSPANQD